jgi:hypothetical protein
MVSFVSIFSSVLSFITSLSPGKTFAETKDSVRTQTKAISATGTCDQRSPKTPSKHQETTSIKV